MTVTVPAFDPDVSRWDPWTPGHVASLLSGVGVPWYVAAGWAIDLFLAEERRAHEDIEIAVPSDRFADLAEALAEYEIFVIAGPRQAVPLDEARDRLEETHQTWVREPSTGLWRLDVFREPSDGGTWICRRDERIRLPYDRVIERTPAGIPYGRPEIVLLYKAKHADNQKDRDDFEAVAPRLSRERRLWLVEALGIVHPGHPWIHELGERWA